jgi:hypothetical protein
MPLCSSGYPVYACSDKSAYLGTVIESDRASTVERRQARHAFSKLSETCDVLFSFARAQYDGCEIRRWPRTNEYRYMLPYTYMMLKYTSRYAIYRTVGVRMAD